MKSYGLMELLRRFPAYRHYWLAMAVSWAGDRFHAVALTTLVLERFPHNPHAIGLVLMAQHLPDALLGLVAGALVDRWPKRLVMVASDVARAGVVVLIPFATELWQVYVAAFIVGLGSTFFFPAWRSTLPAVVPREALLEANAYHWTTRSVIDIVAPVGAAALIGGTRSLDPALYVAPAFWIDSLSYLVSAWCLWHLPVPVPRAERGPAVAGVWADVLAGIRYHRENPTVWALLLLMASFAWGANGANALMQQAVPALLGAPAERWGILLAAMGAGMIAGNLWIVRAGKAWPRRHIIGAGYLGAAIGLIALALTRQFGVAFIIYAFLGAANAAFLSPQAAWVQEVTDPRFLGRVEATRTATIYVGMTFSPLLAAWLVETLGSLSAAMMAISTLFLIPAVLSVTHPALREAPLEQEPVATRGA